MGGAVFVCEKGKLEINRNKFTSNPKSIATELLKKVDEAEEEKKWSDQTALWQARWHLQNWLDCIKTRQKPVADVEIGHRSISVCHLVNITRRIGRPLKWDPAKETFVGDEEANAWSNVRGARVTSCRFRRSGGFVARITASRRLPQAKRGRA